MRVTSISGLPWAESACDVSLSTVRNQLHAVYGKLGVRNKTELASVFAGGAGQQR
jgi:DNA-binding NarL/FixJ family response regulator